MHDRKRIILIISIIVVCVIGLGYYGLNFSKETSKKSELSSQTESEQKTIKPIVVSKDKIKTIEGNKDVLLLNDDRIVYWEDTALKVTDRKANTDEVIYKGDGGDKIVGICSDGNYIAYIERKARNNEENQVACMVKIYNIKSKQESIIDKEIWTVNDKGEQSCKYFVGNVIEIKDNKVIYSDMYTDGINKIMSYDIESGKKSIVTSVDCKKIDLSQIHSFDIDLKNGYMICDAVVYTDNESYKNVLVLIDIRNNKQTVLLKSSEQIDKSTSIEYPNIVFENKDKIHVYNIEKKKDDFTIKCGEDACNVDIKDGLISWNDNKIYVFSIKDKKKYEIDNGWFKDSPNSEGQKRISGDVMYWKDYAKVRYIKMSDIIG